MNKTSALSVTNSTYTSKKIAKIQDQEIFGKIKEKINKNIKNGGSFKRNKQSPNTISQLEGTDEDRLEKVFKKSPTISHRFIPQLNLND